MAPAQPPPQEGSPKPSLGPKDSRATRRCAMPPMPDSAPWNLSVVVSERDCTAHSSLQLTKIHPYPGCGQILMKRATRLIPFWETRPSVFPDEGIHARVVPEWAQFQKRSN